MLILTVLNYTYDFNDLVKCQKSHYSCGSCGGIEETDCLTCMENENRYQVRNTCVCKNGYFDIGLPICEKCSYQFKDYKSQSDSCTSSQDNTFRIIISGFNKCQCIQGYYDDGQNEICQSIQYQKQFATIFKLNANFALSNQIEVIMNNFQHVIAILDIMILEQKIARNATIHIQIVVLVYHVQIQKILIDHFIITLVSVYLDILIMVNQQSVKNVIFNVQVVQINLTSFNPVLKQEKYKVIANVQRVIMMQASNFVQIVIKCVCYVNSLQITVHLVIVINIENLTQLLKHVIVKLDILKQMKFVNNVNRVVKHVLNQLIIVFLVVNSEC
ncbi:unnamed protein product [Paramecium sonneborni]|nr:unnamed protein product [Paramecium sonneborni]